MSYFVASLVVNAVLGVVVWRQRAEVQSAWDVALLLTNEQSESDEEDRQERARLNAKIAKLEQVASDYKAAAEVEAAIVDELTKHNGHLQTQIAGMEKDVIALNEAMTDLQREKQLLFDDIGETAKVVQSFNNQITALETELATYRKPADVQAAEHDPRRLHDWCANGNCAVCTARLNCVEQV